MALRLFLPPLLLLAATLFITQTQAIGSSAEDCCLQYSRKAIPTSVVTSYHRQEPESGCLLRAVVFTTKNDRKICASPKDGAVQKLIERLDKKAKNKKRAQTQRPKDRRKKRRQQQV